ncbi:RNA dependent RNA polymerase-domain-containing protein [Mycena rebaudengoi]|nr:RNA dependent RNA polymerase-domain-containing protein [Mycena rebaudengoi]
MGDFEDSEMSMSQAAYNALDDSYPPGFWEAASRIDGQPGSTQGSSGSDTAVGSRESSASDVTKISNPNLGGDFQTTPPRSLIKTAESPSRSFKAFLISGSPSKSPRFKPVMAARRLAAAGSTPVMPLARPSPRAPGPPIPNVLGDVNLRKRGSPSPDAALPPSKIRKVSGRPAQQANPRVIDCNAGPSRRRAPGPNRLASATAATGLTLPQNGFSLSNLFGGKHGSSLPEHVVFHSDELQAKFDQLQIARGVQWEIVRGILSQSWLWEDVNSKIDKLTGSNAQIGPCVRQIMLGDSSAASDMALGSSTADIALWQELDREAKAKVDNKSHGLGLMGPYENVPDYYGGKVQCQMRLVTIGEDASGLKKYAPRLEPLEMTRSTHLARELGSVSVIALRDDDGGMGIKFLAGHKIIICGRVYLCLLLKDGKAYLIETNGNWRRKPQAWCGDLHRISFDEYIRNNNPMDLNAKQPFAKYSTRFTLFVSTSIPAVEFSVDSIFFIDDEYADGMSKEQNPPTETIMTDGCGFLNRAAAQKICERLKYDRPPVAYQGRIAGSKGVWIIDPDDDSSDPRIWIRDSQKKINLHSLSRAHRIFDLLAVSRPSSSVSLSKQPIMILAHNGVPFQCFSTLQEQGLKDLITPLMQWHGENATAQLWDAINQVGNVTRCRLQRLAAGASRALGFEKRRFDATDPREDEDLDADFEELAQSSRNALNGAPLSVNESALDLLQAGFDPLKLPLLSSKISYVIKNTMESFLSKYKIPLVTSLDAYIIPDPSGQLKEGEVFFKSSTDPDGPLQEQVVVGRYPMREPSDMQKVTAVNIPALSKYVDVLIISLRGSRSLASLLSGGDTDGDEAIIIREKSIVESFRNRPFVPPPDDFLATNFQRQMQSVADFGASLQNKPLSQAQLALQEELVAGLADNKVGFYSNYHEVAVYEYGLAHSETRRLAHMVSVLLDAGKTGLRLLDAVGKADRAKFGAPRAQCFDRKSPNTKKRNESALGPFILDQLFKAGDRTKDVLMKQFDIVATHITMKPIPPPDSDIIEPHRAMAAAVTMAPHLAQEMSHLEEHVKVAYEKWKALCGKTSKYDPAPEVQKKRKGPTKQTDNIMLPVMLHYRRLDTVPFLTQIGKVDEIKASYAYSLQPNFGFSMAFRDICEIKRRAEIQRGARNKVAFIDEARSMNGSTRRLLKHMGGLSEAQ